MFAKLYETEEVGQILVKLEEGSEGPEVRFFIQPEGLGVCNVATRFTDSDSGWKSAEEFFQKVDKVSALAFVQKTMAELNLICQSEKREGETGER